MAKAKAAIAGGYFDVLPVNPADVRELTATATSQSVTVVPGAIYYLGLDYGQAAAIRFITGIDAATADGTGNYAKRLGDAVYVIGIPNRHNTFAYIRDDDESADVTFRLEGVT